MTTVAKRPTLVSEVVKYESGAHIGYAREVKTLTVAAFLEDGSGSAANPHGVEIGQVYKADGTIIVAADVASLSGDAVRILIDDTVYTDGHAAGTGSYVVLGAAPAGGSMTMVARESLKFGDALSPAQIDAVVAELNAQGIKVVTQV